MLIRLISRAWVRSCSAPRPTWPTTITEPVDLHSNVERVSYGYENFCEFTSERSQEVYRVLYSCDFKFNPQFTDETAACMMVGEDIFVMLLTHDKFKTFTPKEICDATKSTEVLVCLSSESRAKVNEMVRKASPPAAQPTMNHKITVLCGHGFQDLDGHIWELIYMEPSALHQVKDYPALARSPSCMEH